MDVARVRRPGAHPFRVLLVAERSLLDATRADGTDVATTIADALTVTADDGLELDLLGSPEVAASTIGADQESWRLWRYHALVVLLPFAEADRVAARRRTERLMELVVPRVRSESTVLVCRIAVEPTPHLDPRPVQPAGPGTPHAAGSVEVRLEDAAGGLARALFTLVPWEAAGPAPDSAAVGVGDRVDATARSTDPRLDRVVQTARRSFGTDYAAVNLLTDDELVTVACAGDGIGGAPWEAALCSRTIRSADLEVIGDTWDDPGLRDDPVVAGPDPLRFYAACSIESFDGARIGALCVADTVPHDPGEFDFTMLRDLALLAEGELLSAPRHRSR